LWWAPTALRRAIAEAIVHDAFLNVTFFDGAIIDLPELVGEEER
jgi:hypothetical protein